MIIHPHLGQLIEDRLIERGMSRSEFARGIYCSKGNVTKLLQRHSINTMQLARIGEVLEYDFFGHLTSSPAPIPFESRTFMLVEIDPEKAKELI